MILDTCLLINLVIICCLFIDKVENVGDRKPRVVDSIKVEAPIKVEASVKVEASSVNSDVWKLCDNEVDTTHFFSTRDTWKDKVELLGWVRRQANRAGFTVIIRRACEDRNVMLKLVCERSGEHKVLKTKVKHEATRSRKCECLFKVRGLCKCCLNFLDQIVICLRW